MQNCGFLRMFAAIRHLCRGSLCQALFFVLGENESINLQKQTCNFILFNVFFFFQCLVEPLLGLEEDTIKVVSQRAEPAPEGGVYVRSSRRHEGLIVCDL